MSRAEFIRHMEEFVSIVYHTNGPVGNPLHTAIGMMRDGGGGPVPTADATAPLAIQPELPVLTPPGAPIALDPTIYNRDGGCYSLVAIVWARRLSNTFHGLRLSTALAHVYERGAHGAREVIRDTDNDFRPEPGQSAYFTRRRGVAVLDRLPNRDELDAELARIITRDFGLASEAAFQAVRLMDADARENYTNRRMDSVPHNGRTYQFEGPLRAFPRTQGSVPSVPRVAVTEPPPGDAVLTPQDEIRHRSGGIRRAGVLYSERQHAGACLLLMHYPSMGLDRALVWTRAHGTNTVEAAIDRRMTIRIGTGVDLETFVFQERHPVTPLPAPNSTVEAVEAPDPVLTRRRRRIALRAAPVERQHDISVVQTHYSPGGDGALDVERIDVTQGMAHRVEYYIRQRLADPVPGVELRQHIAGPFASEGDAWEWASKLLLI